MLGETVGSYKIVAKIASGGMGVVYRAEHLLIGKIAAVKLLRKEVSAKPRIVKRFFDEARTTTAIRHPGIVEVFDFGYYSDGRAYLIMEFLEGETLKQRIRRRGIFRADEAIPIIRNVASAVGAAHQKGVVHRDLKPDNVFLVPDPDFPGGERTKVLDFGLAKLFDDDDSPMATKSGAVMGTPTYMAPEQCKGAGAVDFRADLYSIGCIFYELMCGRPPFVADGVGELIGAHLHREVEPPRQFNARLHLDLEKVLLRLLAKQPENRYKSTDELRAVLDRPFPEDDDTLTAVAFGLNVPPPTSAARGEAPARPDGESAPWPAPPPLAGDQPSTLGESAAQMIPSATPMGDDGEVRYAGASQLLAPGSRSQPYSYPSGPYPSLVDSRSESLGIELTPRWPMRWIAIAGGAIVLVLILVAVRGLSGDASPGEPGVAAGSASDAAAKSELESQIASVAGDDAASHETGEPGGDDEVGADAAPATIATSGTAGQDNVTETGQDSATTTGEASPAAGGDSDQASTTDSEPNRPASKTRKYVLTLRVRPPGARVEIDGEARKGDSFQLPRGSHQIRVSAEGHKIYSSRIKLVRDRTVDITLKRDLPFDPDIDL